MNLKIGELISLAKILTYIYLTYKKIIKQKNRKISKIINIIILLYMKILKIEKLQYICIYSLFKFWNLKLKK